MKEQIRRDSQPESDNQSPNWKLNFGLAVASLYDSKELSPVAYSELGDSVTEISSAMPRQMNLKQRLCCLLL